MFGRFPIYPVLPASDLERAKTWYSEKLGMIPAKEEMGLWYECAEGTWLLVYPTGTAGTAQNTQAHFQVTGIEGLMDEVRGRGGAFEEYDYEPFTEWHGGGGTVRGRWVQGLLRQGQRGEHDRDRPGSGGMMAGSRVK